MSYTTQEKVAVEEARFASKMDVLKQTAEAEIEYDNATREQRTIRDERIADIKATAKDTLIISIGAALETVRAKKNVGGENDE